MLKQLINLFIKQTGRKPNAVEMLKLNFKASSMKEGQILKGDFSKGDPKRWTRDKGIEEILGPKMDEAAVDFVRRTEGEEAAKVFRKKLNEIAVFNSNLAYATKLFMEHSTTKTEKMEILKRFDNVSTLKESKSLFRSIEGEMGTKAPVTESIEKTIKAPKAGALIKEDTAYVDPQVARMKFLMEKLG